jgi:hypothetical protein
MAHDKKCQREARIAVDEAGMGSVARKAIPAATFAAYAIIRGAVVQLRLWGAREENGQSADVT